MKIFDLIIELQYFQRIVLVYQNEGGKRITLFEGSKFDLCNNMNDELFHTLSDEVAVIENNENILTIVTEGR